MPLFMFNGKTNAYEFQDVNIPAQVIMGEFNATTAGYGIPVSSGRTWIMRGNADDGGVVLTGTGAAYLFSSRRLLLTAAQTGNNSFFGGCDRLSINADVSGVTGVVGAHWGMLEVKSGGTIGGAAGVGAVRGDINNNGVLASGGVESCFLAACEKIAGTHTGTATVLHVPTPQSGTFDFFGVFTSACGAATVGTMSHESVTAAAFLPVKIDATTYYIPCLSA